MRLRELGERLGCKVQGDGEVRLHGAASLEQAGPGELSFVRSPAYAERLAASRAGAVVVPPGIDPAGRPSLLSHNPGLDFARAVALLVPPPRPPAGVHETAAVAGDAVVDPSASVGPLCSVGAGASVGPGAVLHAGVHVYAGARIGAECVLHAGCIVREGTELGARVVLQPGVVLGGDGFGYAFGESGRLEKVPQIGRVVIEDDVEIGANTTVDRATLGETRIRRGAKLDNLVMVAHNCDVGPDAVIVSQSGIAGSTTLEAGVMMMAQSGASGHLTIGRRAFVAARAGIHKDVEPGARVYGAPAMEERRWHRVIAAMSRLPEALRRLRAVEKKVGIGLPGSGGEDG